MNVTKHDIEIYLAELKKAIKANRYRIARNENRLGNNDLFFEYVIDEEKAKDILLQLDPTDFSEIRSNKKCGYEHELLYIFGKDVVLLERMGTEEKTVSLYIKFNKLKNYYVIVVSFHEQEYPIKYCFK